VTSQKTAFLSYEHYSPLFLLFDFQDYPLLNTSFVIEIMGNPELYYN
jgi:hypothetical protein